MLRHRQAGIALPSPLPVATVPFQFHAFPLRVCAVPMLYIAWLFPRHAFPLHHSGLPLRRPVLLLLRIDVLCHATALLWASPPHPATAMCCRSIPYPRKSIPSQRRSMPCLCIETLCPAMLYKSTLCLCLVVPFSALPLHLDAGLCLCLDSVRLCSGFPILAIAAQSRTNPYLYCAYLRKTELCHCVDTRCDSVADQCVSVAKQDDAAPCRCIALLADPQQIATSQIRCGTFPRYALAILRFADATHIRAIASTRHPRYSIAPLRRAIRATPWLRSSMPCHCSSALCRRL